jgi:transcriptional regulator
MYTPAHATQSDPATLREMAAAIRFAVLFTAGPGGPLATHLPLVWDGEAALVGHVARANPHWRDLEAGAPAIAVFQGPQAYVSPALYPSKQVHGKVVPTWNYVAVHAAGTAFAVDGAEEKHRIVSLLTNTQEASRAQPWAVTDAPEPFVAAQLRGIVGIRVDVTGLTGSWKLSANRDTADHAGVRAGLAQGDAMAQAVARLMHRT